jgi:hypothetical protein
VVQHAFEVIGYERSHLGQVRKVTPPGLEWAAGFELLVYRKNKVLTRVVGRSTPAPADAPVRRHQKLVRFGLSTAVAFGVLTAISASISSLTLVPAMMVGFGVVELIEAERVRRWEREQDSELLVSIAWGLRPTYSYFVRPLARP